MINLTGRKVFYDTKQALLGGLLDHSHHSKADIAAAHEYIERRERRSHPASTIDSGGRVRLKPEEYCSCCDSIRPPSRKWRFTEALHARTLPHVATLYQANEKTARKIANFTDKALKPTFGLAPYFLAVRDEVATDPDEPIEEHYDRQIEAAWDLVNATLPQVSELSLKRQAGIYAREQKLTNPNLLLMKPYMDECFRWLWKSDHAPIGRMTFCPPKMPVLETV